ncbi:NAD-dependent epimerase [Gordoniibacillus kamchatkensis]|uniref:NAD-dependent epimerase n=1 Tax=Gordoniibacillus kamchatkensis TaxID=1590651 RepID=A0ABR5A617_9BACL|nr:TIGR01777 family oxidoreductase [Paenibacillus sp. VKM B-2647]KIL36078.1 NAD-dependent epimerase [Paenibacillus sp. VKM B-2647]
MAKKVVLAGGTGFIGSYFEEKLTNLGYEVVTVSRQSGHVSWNDEQGIVQALEHSDLLVNLAGKSVDCRYNDKNKADILRSRTETTRLLGNALLACKNPPPLWINASTATIYRHAEDRPMTEDGGELGSGFSVEVAKAWEQAFFSFALPATRQAALRIAIVLGRNGGVMAPYKNLVRFGLGGVQGPGSQRFSWIHVEDLFRIVLFLKESEHISGVFNCSAPYPITNRELMNRLRSAMGRRVGLPSPEWLLEIGAFLIRTETELILKSRWVLPDRLQREGFAFTFDTIDKALQDVLQ